MSSILSIFYIAVLVFCTCAPALEARLQDTSRGVQTGLQVRDSMQASPVDGAYVLHHDIFFMLQLLCALALHIFPIT